MLLTTAGIVLARKIRDEKKRKQFERQGALNVGDSEVAKKAFASQTNKMIITSAGEPGPVPRTNAGTKLTIEAPDSLGEHNRSSTGSTVAVDADERPHSGDGCETADRRSLYRMTSSGSQKGASRDSTASSQPPPYSPGVATSGTLTPATMTSLGLANTLSRDSDGSSSMFSNDSMALKIKSRGPDLRSGFAYHPGLCDLQVNPDMWETFTRQVIEATKFGAGDNARVWAAATATALTGAVVTAAFVGYSYKRSMMEKKIQQGLVSGSEGGLGEVLSQWNDTYFHERGLLVTLQMSEAAQKRAEYRSSKISFRGQGGLFSTKEEKESKKEEQKYTIVVSKLDDVIKRLEERAGSTQDSRGVSFDRTDDVPELPAPGDSRLHLAELPADDASAPVELPAMVKGLATTRLVNEKASGLPAELPAELPGDVWRSTGGKPAMGQEKDGVHELGAT